MKFEICHVTHYQYKHAVGDSVNEIRLTPRTNYRQSCYHHRITVEPVVPLMSYEDHFGNRVHSFTLNTLHQDLKIIVHSTVVTHNNDMIRKTVLTPVEDWQMIDSDRLIDQYAEYLVPTTYVSFEAEAAWVTDHIRREPPYGVLEWLSSLALRIYNEFEYNPYSTLVNTAVAEFLQKKKGVCQDFAHLMIAICRMNGIPARYVSGYHFIGDLQTRTANFEQASHAWVEAYVPGTGWFGFDPTNNTSIDWRYVKLGHGLDYVDIVPVKGVYRGLSDHSLNVTVDVQSME